MYVLSLWPFLLHSFKYEEIGNLSITLQLWRFKLLGANFSELVLELRRVPSALIYLRQALVRLPSG